MNGFSFLPLIQFRLGQGISLCRNQVIIRRYRSAISSAGQNMKYQSDSECSAAFFAGALDLKSFAGDSDLANLSAEWAGEIQHATESGAELVGSGNFVHDKDFVT